MPSAKKRQEKTMYWTEIKSALLYGHPQITHDTLQPQGVKMAVQEIVRLANFGWIDELTDDVVQRIQLACQMSQCPEIWDEFRYARIPRLQQQETRKSKKTRQKRQSKQAAMKASLAA